MSALEKIDLNLLLMLDWLLKEKSVTRAAARMGVTQPAASRSLQKLREIFGDELLVRSGRTHTLSKFALDLKPGLASAIMSLREVTRAGDAFNPDEATHGFTIASNDYLAALGIRAWQSDIQPEAPGLNATWRPLEREVLEHLVSGGVDLVFAPYAAGPNMPKSATVQDMVVRPLLEDRFVMFARHDHPLLGSRTISLEAFAAAQHVLVSPQGRGRSMVDQKLQTQGITRNISHRSWSFGLAADLALETNSICVLPERLARLHQNGKTRSLPFEIDPLNSFVAWHASRTSDQAHSWVRNRFINYFRDR